MHSRFDSDVLPLSECASGAEKSSSGQCRQHLMAHPSWDAAGAVGVAPAFLFVDFG